MTGTPLLRCPHPDIRASEIAPSDRGPAGGRRRAIACFACGRLFGWLGDDETFKAYNPPSGLAERGVRWTDEDGATHEYGCEGVHCDGCAVDPDDTTETTS